MYYAHSSSFGTYYYIIILFLKLMNFCFSIKINFKFIFFKWETDSSQIVLGLLLLRQGSQREQTKRTVFVLLFLKKLRLLIFPRKNTAQFNIIPRVKIRRTATKYEKLPYTSVRLILCLHE